MPIHDESSYTKFNTPRSIRTSVQPDNLTEYESPVDHQQGGYATLGSIRADYQQSHLNHMLHDDGDFGFEVNQSNGSPYASTSALQTYTTVGARDAPPYARTSTIQTYATTEAQPGAVGYLSVSGTAEGDRPGVSSVPHDYVRPIASVNQAAPEISTLSVMLDDDQYVLDFDEMGSTLEIEAKAESRSLSWAKRHPKQTVMLHGIFAVGSLVAALVFLSRMKSSSSNQVTTDQVTNDVDGDMPQRLVRQVTTTSTQTLRPLIQDAISKIESNSLTTLRLSNDDVTDKEMIAIAEVLASNQALKFLSVQGGKVTSVGVKALAEALMVNQALEIMVLDSNPIGDKGAEILAKVLKVNQGLKELYIGNCQISTLGSQLVARSLEVNQALRTLDIIINAVGPLGAIAFAHMMRINPTLRNLKLHGTNLGDDGALVIASALMVNELIYDLTMGYNDISNQGAQLIYEALRVNHVVRQFHLDNNLEIASNLLNDINQLVKDKRENASFPSFIANTIYLTDHRRHALDSSALGVISDNADPVLFNVTDVRHGSFVNQDNITVRSFTEDQINNGSQIFFVWNSSDPIIPRYHVIASNGYYTTSPRPAQVILTPPDDRPYLRQYPLYVTPHHAQELMAVHMSAVDRDTAIDRIVFNITIAHGLSFIDLSTNTTITSYNQSGLYDGHISILADGLRHPCCMFTISDGTQIVGPFHCDIQLNLNWLVNHTLPDQTDSSVCVSKDNAASTVFTSGVTQPTKTTGSVTTTSTSIIASDLARSTTTVTSEHASLVLTQTSTLTSTASRPLALTTTIVPSVTQASVSSITTVNPTATIAQKTAQATTSIRILPSKTTVVSSTNRGVISTASRMIPAIDSDNSHDGELSLAHLIAGLLLLICSAGFMVSTLFFLLRHLGDKKIESMLASPVVSHSHKDKPFNQSLLKDCCERLFERVNTRSFGYISSSYALLYRHALERILEYLHESGVRVNFRPSESILQRNLVVRLVDGIVAVLLPHAQNGSAWQRMSLFRPAVRPSDLELQIESIVNAIKPTLPQSVSVGSPQISDKRGSHYDYIDSQDRSVFGGFQDSAMC